MHDTTGRNLLLISLEAGLAGLAVACGLALAAIPNVELFTFVVFLSGALLGPRGGMRVGVLASIVYGFTSPWGFPPLPTFTSLILARVYIGWLGGWISPRLGTARRGGWDGWFLVSGLATSLGFQALTTLALALTMDEWTVVVAGAVPFALVNVVTNALVFVVLGPPTLDAARRLPIPGLR